MKFDDECEKYSLQDYSVPRLRFDSIGVYVHTIRRSFVPNKEMEDHWLNYLDDYEIQIRDHYRMDLKLAEEVLHIPIYLKDIDKDFLDILDPLYNRDKIL